MVFDKLRDRNRVFTFGSRSVILEGERRSEYLCVYYIHVW